MLTPTPLADKEVLEIFRDMNDVIRMRMITTEVLPSPMQNYKIGKNCFFLFACILFSNTKIVTIQKMVEFISQFRTNLKLL